MINILEYDEEKLFQDEKEIKSIAESLKNEATGLENELKNATLLKLLNSQDKLINEITRDYDKLMIICNELLHITSNIELSRKNYRLCEEKISDLLDKIKISRG